MIPLPFFSLPLTQGYQDMLHLIGMGWLEAGATSFVGEIPTILK